MSKLAKITYLWRLIHWGHLVENLQLVNIHPVKIIKLGFVEKNYLWVETRRFVNCHPVENSMMKLCITHFISLHMTYFVSSFRSARRRCRINVVCFCFARFKNRLNSSEGLKDLFMSIGWNKYKPSRVRTLERTTYSQFLKRPPFGHEVTMITSFDIPCNLWPVVASLQFTGNCLILHLNSVFPGASGCTLTFTTVCHSSVSILNKWWSVSSLSFSFSMPSLVFILRFSEQICNL